MGYSWQAIAATARGAHHAKADRPSQDAWRTVPVADGGLVVAVADGHGHTRHFRSDRGATMAVEAACGAALAWVDGHSAGASGPPGADALPAEVWRRWRAAVDADLACHPFTTEEDGARSTGDDPVLAYGSTLLAAIVVGGWAVLLRIGDGDIVAARPDGSVLDPLPKDPQLAGEQTTSLCQPDAVAAFHHAVLDLEAEPLSLLLLSTDGYGNAQSAEPWQPGVGADLVTMVAEHGLAWVDARLPSWVAACASAEGSGDDTTVVLVVGGP